MSSFTRPLRLWLFIAVWGLLLLISFRSHYTITDIKSMNWDIALMLSPWGFLHNYLLVPNDYLRPYYDYPADRGALFHDPILIGLVLSTVILSLIGLIYFRLEKKRQ